MKHFIYLTLANRLLIIVFVAGLTVTGLVSFRSLPVDAFPDVTPALVQIFTETEGLALEEVERYVTYPVEAAMNGLPSLKEIRSTSNFGLSVVNIYFEDGTNIYFARQLVCPLWGAGAGRGARRIACLPRYCRLWHVCLFTTYREMITCFVPKFLSAKRRL